MRTLSQNAAWDLVLSPTDIGNTEATSAYLEMENFSYVEFLVKLGTTWEGTNDGWNAADRLLVFKILQATDSAGTGAKVISGSEVTTPTLGVAGHVYWSGAWASAMDKANSFTHVAGFASMTDNTGADYVSMAGIRLHPRYPNDDLTSAYHAIAG